MNDTGVAHVITGKGLAYAILNKKRPEELPGPEDDDKYMNIDEIGATRKSDYADKDDEAQPYNSYALPDEPGRENQEESPRNISGDNFLQI